MYSITTQSSSLHIAATTALIKSVSPCSLYDIYLTCIMSPVLLVLSHARLPLCANPYHATHTRISA